MRCLQQFVVEVGTGEGAVAVGAVDGEADVGSVGGVVGLGAIGGGDLADSLFTCDNPNLVIDTVKVAENSDEIVVRLYESNGCSGTAVLNVGAPIAGAAESNLIEQKTGDVTVENNAITFNFTPYEIKTFLIHL